MLGSFRNFWRRTPPCCPADGLCIVRSSSSSSNTLSVHTRQRGLYNDPLTKHRKNCKSCPTQVTWKVKFKCQICLSCLSSLTYLSCLSRVLIILSVLCVPCVLVILSVLFVLCVLVVLSVLMTMTTMTISI